MKYELEEMLWTRLKQIWSKPREIKWNEQYALWASFPKDFGVSEKELYATLIKWESKNLIECGSNLRACWPTEKGESISSFNQVRPKQKQKINLEVSPVLDDRSFKCMNCGATVTIPDETPNYDFWSLVDCGLCLSCFKIPGVKDYKDLKGFKYDPEYQNFSFSGLPKPLWMKYQKDQWEV